MCLRIGTSFLLDIGLATCTHQIGGARFWIGHRVVGGCRCCCTITSRRTQCDAIAKHTQIRSIAHAIQIRIGGLTLQAFNKFSPTNNRFTWIQPHRRCNTDQHWAHIFYHEYDKYWPRFVLMVSTIVWAWYWKYNAHILIPLQHPCVEIIIFVK